MEEEKRIMLVEDNSDDVTLTLRALKQANILNEVVVAHDGVEAMELLEDASRPLPTVVLLDLQLPRLSGLEVLQRMRDTDRLRRVPVVILTSSREEQDRLRGYDFGANSYVQKPIHSGEFLEAVSKLGMYWLLLNEPPPPVEVDPQ
ncbi:MAG: response regulator [Actinobacteria bacterium]|nr:response regulator [Actinomycetota bacterium]